LLPLVVGAGAGLALRTVHGSTGGNCEPLLAGWGGKVTTCFEASEATLAEQHLPFHAVSPVAIAETATGLQLSQVLLQTGAGVGVEPGPILTIVYIFGALRSGGSIPFPAPVEPKFVIVRELVYSGHVSPIIDRAEGVVGNMQGKERNIVGPWHFGATFPGNGALLTVTANLPRATVQAMGEAIWERENNQHPLNGQTTSPVA